MTRRRDFFRGVGLLTVLRVLARLLPGGRGARRAGDQVEDPLGERIVMAALLLSVVGSVGFAAAYVADAGPTVQGAALATALLALAVALATWGERLVPHRVVAEEREPMMAPEPERDQLVEDVTGPFARRGFLVRMLAVAFGSLGLAALFPVASLGPSPGGRVHSTAWRRGARLVTPEGDPVEVGRLPVGGTLSVFPEGATEAVAAQVVLIRMDPADLESRASAALATAEGYVAFSQICTHAGCPVGLYEQRSRRLLCPCHQSVFDVRDGARPVGGPAIRPLPQLPIAVDADGYLVALGDFPEPAGPDTWEALS